MKQEPHVSYPNEPCKEAFLTHSKGIRSIEWRFWKLCVHYVHDSLFNACHWPLKFQIQLLCLLMKKESLLQTRDLVLPEKPKNTSVSSPCEMWQTSVSGIFPSGCSYPTEWPRNLLVQTEQCRLNDQTFCKWSSLGVRESVTNPWWTTHPLLGLQPPAAVDRRFRLTGRIQILPSGSECILIYTLM